MSKIVFNNNVTDEEKLKIREEIKNSNEALELLFLFILNKKLILSKDL